jgi:bacterioferritin
VVAARDSRDSASVPARSVARRLPPIGFADAGRDIALPLQRRSETEARTGLFAPRLPTFSRRCALMPATQVDTQVQPTITREQLAERLNEDLAREYQAVIAYVVYSQAIKGAQYMSIAQELEKHAAEELSHAITIAKQIDYLGAMPTAKALPVKISEDAVEMLRADLDNENATVKAYRQRVKECEALGEYAIAEEIREILKQEQEHQVDLATALGEDVPDVSKLK